MTRSGSTRSSIGGPGPPPFFVCSTMPSRPFGLSDSRDVAQEHDGLLHLVIRVDDQHGVDRLRESLGFDGVPSTGLHAFSESFALDAALIDSIISGWMSSAYTRAVRADAAREADREPAAAGAEVSDDACLRRSRARP